MSELFPTGVTLVSLLGKAALANTCLAANPAGLAVFLNDGHIVSIRWRLLPSSGQDEVQHSAKAFERKKTVRDPNRNKFASLARTMEPRTKLAYMVDKQSRRIEIGPAEGHSHSATVIILHGTSRLRADDVA